MSQTEQPLRSASRWDFLTNHAHVLLCVARDPAVRLREIAEVVGITERAAHRIVSELVEEGYLSRERRGRRNHYTVEASSRLRHPMVDEREVGELLELLLDADDRASVTRQGGKSRVSSAQ